MPKPRSPRSILVGALEACESPVWLIDDRHRLKFVNEALARRLGEHRAAVDDADLAIDVADRSPIISAWIRALLPPPHAFVRPGVRFPIALPDPRGIDSTDPNASATDSVDAWERFEGLVLPLASPEDGETCWLVATFPEQEPLDDLPARLRELHREWQATTRRENDPFADLLAGDSPAAMRLRERVALAQRAPVRTVISGPSGSGHEALARRIHSLRPTSLRGPLMVLDCTLLDAELIQATYRDLVRESRAADRGIGCLLLDRIDRLVDTGQQELLNLLRFPQVPFTTIVTTHRPLGELVAAGSFDAELAQRLEVLEIAIPPLAERLEDLPLLAHAVLQRTAQTIGSEAAGWSDEALARLQRHPWPDNFRELGELAERVAREATGAWVRSGDLPKHFGQAADPRNASDFRLEPFDLEGFLKEIEEELIRMALAQCGGNKTRAARLLGISRGGLHRRLGLLDDRGTEEVESDDDPERRARLAEQRRRRRRIVVEDPIFEEPSSDATRELPDFEPSDADEPEFEEEEP